MWWWVWLWWWILGFLLLLLSENKDVPASVVILRMNILSWGWRHLPYIGLMDMPRNVFRLTPSFVTVACPNKADGHEAVDHDFDIKQ